MERRVIDVDERLPLLQTLPLSLQHLFAMFGATVLVPFLFKVSPATSLLLNGIGTLVYIAVQLPLTVYILESFFARIPSDLFDAALAETRRDEVDGLEVVRVRYIEWRRPTVVRDGHGGDQPVFGWFLVDAVTGAIVESRMEARREESTGLIVVRYRRDPGIGLWVPSEMRESYSLPGSVTQWRTVQRELIECHATYSNFRRFQVKTEEKIAPPK